MMLGHAALRARLMRGLEAGRGRYGGEEPL